MQIITFSFVHCTIFMLQFYVCVVASYMRTEIWATAFYVQRVLHSTTTTSMLDIGNH
jgi:hypothetical protein